MPVVSGQHFQLKLFTFQRVSIYKKSATMILMQKTIATRSIDGKQLKDEHLLSFAAALTVHYLPNNFEPIKNPCEIFLFSISVVSQFNRRLPE